MAEVTSQKIHSIHSRRYVHALSPLLLGQNAFNDDNKKDILCPLCKPGNNGYSHSEISKVSIIQGTRVTEITGDAVSDDQRLFTEQISRGSIVHLLMTCESGHCYSVDISFYKGNTSICCIPFPELNGDAQGALWRD